MVVWCGFLGAWLLVAGSGFQAALELREWNSLRDEIVRVFNEKPAPSSVSRWWWLLPPVHFLLQHGRRRTRQQATMRDLSPSQQRELIQYMNKAAGWSMVGFGGSLLAVKETWELAEHY